MYATYFIPSTYTHSSRQVYPSNERKYKWIDSKMIGGERGGVRGGIKFDHVVSNENYETHKTPTTEQLAFFLTVFLSFFFFFDTTELSKKSQTNTNPFQKTQSHKFEYVLFCSFLVSLYNGFAKIQLPDTRGAAFRTYYTKISLSH